MSEDDRQLVTGTDILPISEVSKGRTLYKVYNYSPNSRLSASSRFCSVENS